MSSAIQPTHNLFLWATDPRKPGEKEAKLRQYDYKTLKEMTEIPPQQTPTKK